MNTKNNHKFGFTLIELIVVMAIIAILAAAGLSSFTSTQKKGRDGRRKADLTQVSRSLEFYYNDHGQYPISNNGLIAACGGTCDGDCSWGGGPMCSPTNAATVYLQTLAKDPVTNYQYFYSSSDGSYYRLYARLENTNDSQIITPAITTDCDTIGSVECNYGISSSNSTP
ncbi:prepilin-type N-terminal cleavage/methylation domain-containing protein [Candidatus Gottesmanbacteria bacterium]|nr:prepilin-type N-terminal cleavage/methylation domain-containing protein [Candidatus Gottesmanbacteria bacterium]